MAKIVMTDLLVSGFDAVRGVGLHQEYVRQGTRAIFINIARKFEAFVALVTEVANLTLARGVQGVTGLLKLYERWEKTHSETLAGALSAHGFQTPRGKKVLQ